MNDGECPGKAARTRRRRLAGHWRHAFGVAPVGIGAMCGEVVLTRVAFPEHDTTIPCQMAKSNVQGRFFCFFRRSVGRPLADGLWPSWVGGKEKPPTSASFGKTPTAGGELRRGYRRLTTPPCVLKHHAPWRCGAHITYIMSS